MINILKYIFGQFFKATLFILVVCACSNNLKEINALSNEKTPDVEIEELNFYYSDSAYIQFRLITPKVIVKYRGKEESTREFPDGITLHSFDKKGAKNTELIADFAIHYIDSNLWLARSNVNCKTQSGIKLKTEKVFWDMQKKIFYNDVPLTIVDKHNTIYGNDLLADENFTYIRIEKTTGKIIVKAIN